MKRILAVCLCCALMLVSCGSALAFSYEKDYFKDDYDSKIKEIQQRLIELEYLSSGADGWFGSKTQAAIKRFQLVSGLEETGVADLTFQEALFADDAKVSPTILMTLDEFKKMMGARTKLVRYDMSLLEVGRNSASMELNNDVVLDVKLLGDGVTEIQLVGKGNVKIPFTVLLMALDSGIGNATMYEALDLMIQDGTRIIDDKLIEYTKDEDGTERLIVSPFVGGTVED